MAARGPVEGIGWEGEQPPDVSKKKKKKEVRRASFLAMNAQREKCDSSVEKALSWSKSHALSATPAVLSPLSLGSETGNSVEVAEGERASPKPPPLADDPSPRSVHNIPQTFSMIKNATGRPRESTTRIQPTQEEAAAGTDSEKGHAQVDGKARVSRRNKHNSKQKAAQILTGMALSIDIIDELSPRVFYWAHSPGLLAFNHCSGVSVWVVTGPFANDAARVLEGECDPDCDKSNGEDPVLENKYIRFVRSLGSANSSISFSNILTPSRVATVVFMSTSLIIDASLALRGSKLSAARLSALLSGSRVSPSPEFVEIVGVAQSHLCHVPAFLSFLMSEEYPPSAGALPSIFEEEEGSPLVWPGMRGESDEDEEPEDLEDGWLGDEWSPWGEDYL
jgi:hypothetical protein